MGKSDDALLIFPLVGGILQASTLFMFKRLFSKRRASGTLLPYFRYPIWWIVWFCVWTLQLTSLVTGLIYCQFALKEDLSVRDFLSFSTIIAGAVLALWVVDVITVSLVVFVLYIFFLLLVIALFFIAWKYISTQLGERSLAHPDSVKQRKALPIVLAVQMAMIQALIYVPIIVFISAYSNKVFVAVMFIIGFFAATGVQLVILHYALNDFDLIYILAVFNTTRRALDFIITALFGGFKDKSTVLYLILPIFGIALMIIGSLVLSLRENCSDYRALEMTTASRNTTGFVAYGEPPMPMSGPPAPISTAQRPVSSAGAPEAPPASRPKSQLQPSSSSTSSKESSGSEGYERSA